MARTTTKGMPQAGRPHTGAQADALDRVERLAFLLDEQFRVPGTNWRVGLDGLLGLVPGIGDAATAVMALYLVAEAKRLGAPNGVIVRMLANVGIDMAVGSVPLLGDLFDFAFKANRRNLRLLRRHFAERGDRP